MGGTGLKLEALWAVLVTLQFYVEKLLKYRWSPWSRLFRFSGKFALTGMVVR